MHEIVINLHMHTYYSDGNATHQEIAQAAISAGIEAVIVTDHNVWVNGPEGYYQEGSKRVLVLVGEEIHDQGRKPQKNHLLVFGAGRELSSLAPDPQLLVEAVHQAGGLAFIAHPFDPASPVFHEPDISWLSWEVQGFHGIELWNAMSEFKGLLKSRLLGLYYAFNPKRAAHGPFPETLAKWDELLARGSRIIAIGGSDAHAFKARLGPLRRTLFPYTFHFQAVNTHVFLPDPLVGEVTNDRRLILDALRQGNVFIGYDLPASTRGFRFTAQGSDGKAVMGEEICAKGGVTMQVRLPQRAECLLIKDGKRVKVWRNQANCTYITSEPGIYRVEVYVEYLGKRRGWIFSNPIYLRP